MNDLPPSSSAGTETPSTSGNAAEDLRLLAGAGVRPAAEVLPASSGSSTWRSWLQLSFADVFIVALVAWTFASGPHGWSSLLTDGDAGWHIRVGEMILDTGAVPHTDPFSFSKPGEAWYAWEWLSDVGMGLLHRAGGLKAIVWFAGGLIALFAGILLRYMMWKGVNALVALGLTLIAVGACSIHFLARPHLVTLVLIPALAWLIDADRKNPSWKLWLVVPAMALWTNLHGGFLAGIVLVGGATAGTLLERRWDEARRYGLLTALCGVATLANPYGFHLHQHVFAYLGSDFIRNAVQEFQSPTFRGESAMQFELLLFLGLITAGGLIARGRFVETVWIAGLAHMALGSQRHITIFASVATPLAAVQLTEWWNGFAAGQSRKSIPGILQQMSKDLAPNFRRNSVWAAVFFAALLAFDAPLMRWPSDFTSVMFPVEILEKYRTRMLTSRVLTTDQWGDYLLYHGYPKQRVFVDGRSDFYGPQTGGDYVHLLNGLHNWQGLMEKYKFDFVVAPVEWPLNSLLKASSRWKLLEDNGKTLVYEKVEQKVREPKF